MSNGITKHKILFRELLPFTFVAVLWLVHLAQEVFQVSFIEYGLMPRTQIGLRGIFTSPFIHADFGHLTSNTIPMLVLGYLFFLFYRTIAFKVFGIMYVLTGALVWSFARGESNHVGASGLIYGLAAFLFFSGVFRRQPKPMVVALLVVFLYGGMVWYVLPIDEHISWEGHLFGALSGTMLAYVYRREGPQRRRFDWEDEPEEENDDGEWLRRQQEELNRGNTEIVYHYREDRKSNTNPPPPPPATGTHDDLLS